MSVDRVNGCSCCGLLNTFGVLRAECGHVFCEICEGRRHHAPCTICEPWTRPEVPDIDGTDVHAW